MRARGLDRSNEDEVADLVRDVAPDRADRPRCRLERRLGPGKSRFACRAAGRRYRVDWQHYGTGRYRIHAVDRSGRLRLVQRGTLTITE